MGLIKQTFVTLGLASGMTAGALFYFHNIDTCRAMVLVESAKQEKFSQQFSAHSDTKDFLTALTQGR